MTDVYNRGTFDRNAIQEPPKGYIDDASNNLFRFLGSFWKQIHTGLPFVKGVQDVRGIKMAQRYLDLLESLKLQDRKGLPVFHRELWKPLVIRYSQRNTAKENEVKVGQEMTIYKEARPQEGGKYEGSVIRIGRLASKTGYVTYPIEGEIVEIVSGIANSVINPTVVHKIGTTENDVRYLNGTLVFPADKDPFLKGSGFDAYDTDEVVEENGVKKADREIVLWASDVLIDKDFIAEHMSYALGATCPSTEIVKRILNTAWDAENCGLTPELLRSIIAAMLNIPVIQEAEETVRDIIITETEKKVVTDAHTYTVFGKANLRSCVHLGAVLSRGEFLDESVKIYPFLDDLSEEKLANITEYADILRQDIPVVTLPKSILSTQTAHGLRVDWNPVEVLTAGEDKNGHQKLFFELGGPEDDVNAFWEDVWSRAEEANIDLEPFFAEYKDPGSSSSSSDDTWMVRPADFFLRYLIGGNTLVITLDHTQIEDAELIRDAMYFNLLNAVVPSGIRLFFIEHVAPSEDSYNFGTDTEDSADTFVSMQADEDEFDYSDLPGMRGKSIPSYEDEVEMKFMRNRRRRAE